MGLILCIESSESICSVSLAKEGNVQAYEFVEEPNGHSKHLATLISSITSKNELSLNDLDAVAISGGPGSYTGLRIGAVMAKGICYGLNVPLIALDTLAIMAYQFLNINPFEAGTLLAPCVDARRMEVYTGVFDQSLGVVLLGQPMVIDEKSFSELLDLNEIVFFGSGANKMQEVVQHGKANYYVNPVHPTAEFMGQLAEEKYQQQEFEDIAYYNPNYLKPVYITRPQKSK